MGQALPDSSNHWSRWHLLQMKRSWRRASRMIIWMVIIIVMICLMIILIINRVSHWRRRRHKLDCAELLSLPWTSWTPCHQNHPRTHKGLSIYYVIRDGGGGSSRFITILHRGGLPNLLQYYIGGFLKVYYNITDLVGIWKGLDHF